MDASHRGAGAVEADDRLATLGGRLIWARQQRAMTQQALGELMGKSRTTIAQYELDNIAPPLSVIEKLAGHLSISSRFLAFGSETERDLAPIQGARPLDLIRSRDGSDETEGTIWISPTLMQDFGLDESTQVVRLDVDAIFLGLRSGDRMFVQPGVGGIRSDGKLYAVRSTAGVTLVRSEPLLQSGPSDDVLLTGGAGEIQRLPSHSLAVIGRVLGSIQRV